MATSKKRNTVVGVFEDRQHANMAIDELKRAGFRDDQIGIVMPHGEGSAVEGEDSEETEAGTGALAGTLTGLGLGALAGLGVLAGVIPVVGPAIAGGTLGVLLSNAALGAGVAGLAGALIGAGIPEEEAQYYHGELEAGRTIVTVTANGRSEEATAIMRRHGAYDMSTRGSTESTAGTATSRRASEGEAAIQVKEEHLRAQKRADKVGEVRVHKEVHTETEHLEVPVRHEEVVVERKPVRGRAAAGGVDDLREGEEIRIPVSEEHVKVTKEPVVTEEVRVGKRTVQETEHVSGQVRKEDVKVEKTGDVDVRSRGGKRST